MSNEQILSSEDSRRILVSVLRHAEPDGLTKEEAIRRAQLIAEHVRDMKIAASMYEMFSEGKIELSLNEDESDVCIFAADAVDGKE